MQRYRLYFMYCGRIRSAREIQADNDQAAIAEAEHIRGLQPAELWDRARVVKTFAHQSDA